MSDPAYTSDRPGAVPNILQAVLRRWPLVLIGAVAGGVIGFLLYSTQPPKYESDAQLQVIKKDNARVANIGFGYIDDYVATQLDVLRSQTILVAASKKMQETSPAFQETLKDDPWNSLRRRLTVARNRDTGGGGAVGNSIVNLSFTADDPRDTQIALDAIIKTYQDELENRTGDTLEGKIKQLNAALDSVRKARDAANRARGEIEQKRARITFEAPAVITQRWTNNNADKYKIDKELFSLEGNLKLIEETGKNRTERAKLLAILSGSRRVGADPTSFTLEGQKLQLELKRKQFSETLGPDHQEMKEIENQLALVNQELHRLNPDDPNGEVDELALYEAQMKYNRQSLDRQRVALEEMIKQDRGILEDLNKLIPEGTEVDLRIADLNKQYNDLESQLSAAQAASATEAQFTAYEAAVLNQPRPGAKVGPVLITWLFPGLFLGGLLGAGLSLLVELRDKSFRSPAEIRERLGVPVIGHLPTIRTELPSEADVSDAYDPSLVAAVRPKSIEAEAYRGVRAQVLQLSEHQGHQVVQVTSPTPGDGKSTLAANLAISLAQSGKRTILLDCDFRKPRVHKLFALPKPEVGLASVTSGTTPLDEAIRHSDVDNLDLLPCGPRPSNPAELLSGPRFQEVLQQLKSRYDVVIVDTPPILAVSDPRVIAQRVDGVVLVFRITNKVRPLAERAREYLADMSANLLGVVVNGGGKSSEYGYGYGAGYSYAYDYDYQYAEGSGDDKSQF